MCCAIGAVNYAPNSPIKGYRRVPNGEKFIKYFKRRPGCMSIPVNEFRTTMLCSLCRQINEVPRNQPKQRYRTCRNCVPRDDLEMSPALNVVTVVGKRKLQRLRKKEKRRLNQLERQQRMNQQHNGDVIMEPANTQPPAPQPQYGPFRPLDLPRPPRIVSKIAYIVKTDRSVGTCQVWNRDVNAGRNILCKGKCTF